MNGTRDARRLVRLNLASSNLAQKAGFYVGVLGMAQTGECAFQYSDAEVEISFTAAHGPYQPVQTDLYWKVAVAVPDLDLACRQLNAMGIAVDGPRQFREVGYLAHITDPDGFKIELIQHVFYGEPKPALRDPTALGGGPCLNLVTLRTSDIAAVRARCVEDLGMKLLCVEPVDDFGFTLYFFADTDEDPPDDDPIAVVNRTWTYQRPYSVLEVQHLHELDVEARYATQRAGYRGLAIAGLTEPDSLLRLVSD